MLTGKAKTEFEKWYLKGQHDEGGYHDYLLRSFYSKGLAMQYGVYVDFFWNTEGQLICFDELEVLNGTMTIEEARKDEIEKANELFNSKN